MELHAANELLSGVSSLRKRLDEEGYLFLRRVLDLKAVTELKRELIAILVENGYAKPDSDDPLWTGKVLVGGKSGTAGPELQEAYESRKLWQRFTETPAIRSAFEAIMGEPIRWIPVAQFRIKLPGDTLLQWHQDGFYAQGVNATTVWVPLMHINQDLGGLEVAVNMNKQGYLHDETLAPIPETLIPSDRRRSAVYEPGDVVMFTEVTPHTGLPNRSTSGLIRLSLDVRFITKSQEENVIFGHLAEKSDGFIVVVRPSGDREVLEITDRATLRQVSGATLNGKDLPKWDMKIGEEIIVAKVNGDVAYVRVAVFKDASRPSGSDNRAH